MKRAYGASQYAKPYERFCRERYPQEADAICRSAEAYYLEFLKEMPDLGKNRMTNNMLDWFTILAFYEASGRRLHGEALLEIKRRSAEKQKWLAAFVDGNTQKWPYRLLERTFAAYSRKVEAHQKKGEWMDC